MQEITSGGRLRILSLEEECMNLTVKKVERIWVDVPFRETPRRNMIRELPHWTVFELCKVHLANGVQGVGETMVFYTWAGVTDEAISQAMGKPATEFMWDDTLGAGLQAALFDAVGRSLGVPVHQLLGRKIRDEAALSWWAIDMSAEDWLSECAEALRQGYVSFKFKARPWFDLRAQLQLIAAKTPDFFEIDLDFNTMLNDSAHALRVLRDVERYPQVKIVESPIPQGDVAGNRFLRSRTGVPIAMHAGNPPLATALTEDLCDGFVITGGVSQVLREAALAAEFNKVFWLQLVGTGVTAAWSLHLAAVLGHARWPAVTCHNLYEHSLLRNPIHVSNGTACVPDAPGLGFEIDWDAVERFRVEPKPKPYPHPDLLIRVNWPSGAADYYAHGLQYWDDFMNGRKPVFAPGVSMNLVPDDGSAHWREAHEEALKRPAWVMRPN
ncbi:MAG: dgoA protein [Planctomycetales bacterium]